MATFDSGRQRYSMNFYASHQRPLQRRSYTGRPSRPAEGQLRVKSCPDGPEVQLPLCPRKRTQLGHRVRSEKCHKATYGCSKEPGYSITSSAVKRSFGGIVTPSAFAVLRLMTSANLVGVCTGRSQASRP